MAYKIIQRWATFFLRLYFGRTIVVGLEHVPKKGPLIVASNHPSAFMEASVLGTVIRRPLHFLVRGDMFNPKFQWLFNWTNQIPIFRQRDGIGNLRKNASSFALTYKKLADGEAVLIFPEAKTLLEKRLRPVQRGTAHLAFGTLPHLKEGDVLHVLPVGVNFIDPRIPGADVIVRFGPAFITEDGNREDRQAIDRFTQTLSDAMHPLVIEVEKDDDVPAYDLVASLYLKSELPHPNDEQVHADLSALGAAVHTGTALSDKANALLGLLRKSRLDRARYYPGLVTQNHLGILCIMLLKACWWVAGGWLWSLIRYLIFSKIRKNTFQSPVTVGAAMVLYPILGIAVFLTILLTGLPLWIFLLWVLLMIAGRLFYPPLSVMMRMLLLAPKQKRELAEHVAAIKSILENLLKDRS